MATNAGWIGADEENPARLMQGLVQGHGQAVEDFLHGYQAKVYRHVYRWLGNREDARDLTQETLLRVFQKANHYDDRYPLTPWVLRIASNLCIDYSRRRNSKVHDSQVELKEVCRTSSFPTPEEETLRKETQSRVMQALDELPPKHRKVLELRMLWGYKLREIAKEADVPLGTVKSTLHVASKQLRQNLSDLHA